MSETGRVPGEINYTFTWKDDVGPNQSWMLTTPTFVIGLGGIGNAVVRLLQERFLMSEGRAKPLTVFLRSIDTAEQSEEATRAERLPKEMYTRIGQFAAAGVIGHLEQHPIIQKWWLYPERTYAAGFIDHGAGARRPLGRLCLFVPQGFNKIHGALSADFEAARKNDLQERLQQAGLERVRLKPRVYIVGSLAGGTCSGTFLDVGILARHILERHGYDAGATEITGIFALPSVIHLRTGDGGSANGLQRKVNTFAALRELDYLMCREQQEPIRINYPPPVGPVPLDSAVFNHVFFFSDTMQTGYVFGQQEDILLRAAHFLYGQIALGTGEATVKTLINVSQYFDPSQRRVADGMGAIYGSFGVEWLEVPQQQMIRSWCREIGESVGALIADFEWDREAKQNLTHALKKRLPDSFRGYAAALEFLSVESSDLGALSQLQDLGVLLQPIIAAQNKSELESALKQFHVSSPGILDTLRRSVSDLPTEPDEVAWIQQVSRELISDPAFRIGGAKRFCKHVAELLSKLGASAGESEISTEDVVKNSTRGLLGNKIDTGPAFEWAQTRLLRQARATIKERTGDRAARFAHRCERQAEILQQLQNTVREECSRLGTLMDGQTPEIPTEMWLLEPEAIDATIRAHLEDLTREVSDRAAQTLSQTLSSLEAVDQPREMAAFGAFIRRMVVEAIRRAAARRTERPPDAIARLKRRMTACSPLAAMVNEGPEFLSVMSDAQRAVPMKIVVTGVPGAEQEELNAWAREEKERAGDPNAFQVISSADALRDDALHLSLGWPLCLYREIRDCYNAFSEAERTHAELAGFSGILMEIPGAAKHRVMPRSTKDAKELFAIAFVLDEVRLVNLENAIFSETVAVTEFRFPVSRDRALREAFDRFHRSGYATRFEVHRTMRVEADPEAFRKSVLDAVEKKRGKLEELKNNEGVAPGLVKELAETYECAERWARKLVVL
ncbi:MAG: tubulin-like doman-containing protein [bacterium]